MRLAYCVLLACVPALPSLAAAQQGPPGACGTDTVINIYRHVLDLEPPESPALPAAARTGMARRAS